MSRFSLSFGLFVALSLTACGGRPPPHPDDAPVLRQPVVAGDGATACTVGPATYALGARFEADDGCNTCTCTSGGVGCTKKACACDPSKEWWRKYYTPAECKAGVQCPGYTTPFTNSCGCGCEQDASCPEWFDCMPPSPCDPDQMKQCPYSGVAY